MSSDLTWTAWRSGRHGQSSNIYGLKVPIVDRERYFDRKGVSVTLILDGAKDVVVNTAKRSFWTETCHELTCKELSTWMIRNKFAPWPHRKPPRIKVTPLGGSRFRVHGPNNS
jgi:hypothetical protein